MLLVLAFETPTAQMSLSAITTVAATDALLSCATVWKLVDTAGTPPMPDGTVRPSRGSISNRGFGRALACDGAMGPMNTDDFTCMLPRARHAAIHGPRQAWCTLHWSWPMTRNQ